MRSLTLSVALTLGVTVETNAQATAHCIEPQAVASTVAKIGAQSSAWILRDNQLVVLGLVATALGLKEATWNDLSMSQLVGSEWKQHRTAAQIVRTINSLPETLHIVRLREGLPWPVRAAQVRGTSLHYGEPVVQAVYAGGELHLAVGRFVGMQSRTQVGAKDYTGFEMIAVRGFEGGKSSFSGGAIFDCSGMLGSTHTRGLATKFGARRECVGHSGGAVGDIFAP